MKDTVDPPPPPPGYKVGWATQPDHRTDLIRRAEVAEARATCLEAENKRLVEVLRILTTFQTVQTPCVHPFMPPSWQPPKTSDPLPAYPVTCSVQEGGLR